MQQLDTEEKLLAVHVHDPLAARWFAAAAEALSYNYEISQYSSVGCEALGPDCQYLSISECDDGTFYWEHTWYDDEDENCEEPVEDYGSAKTWHAAVGALLSTILGLSIP